MTTHHHRWLARLAIAGCAAVSFVASTAAPIASATDDHAYNGAPTIVSGGPVPTMNGVPCVGGHLGTCTGFAQNNPPRRVPRSSVGHSPTVSP
ncbi:hypothetical protein [Mycolicibacterium sediminis]|uniref:Uncharacterized protein n=1 Tax=Mycolicibacterium sediminis TaxID=1286180 RepID=A0A7I7QP28_9MYCO|nr:hypothetical protein [Mycolicibacterium sediminis]BBY27757.1 hypothetical protein MSEDJ_18530 [Mycolicibacterium sediminis]